MSNELYKATLRYNIGRVVKEAVFFALICSLIFWQVFDYEPGWFWITESFAFIVLYQAPWLYISGRCYKKYKRELDEMMDKVFEYKT